MAHIKVFHKNYEREAKETQSTPKIIEILPVRMNIYGWTDWICCRKKPFYTVENDLDRRFSELNPIFYKTFMKYLELVTRKVAERVANEIPNKFALVIDGCGKESTHRIGIFASYPWQDTNRIAL